LKRSTTLAFTAFLVSSLFTATAGYGADYYVDVDSRGGRANDENPGTLNRPWKTIARAFDTARTPRPGPGDTLWVRGGRYREQVRITSGGIAENPFAIRAFRTEKPIIDGEGKRPNGFVLPSDGNADHVIIEGLAFEDFGSGGAGILVCERSDVTIRSVDVSGARIGVWFIRCTDCKLLRSDIHHCEWGNVYVDTTCSNIVIAGNHIHHSLRSHGLSCYAPADHVVAMGKVTSVEAVAPGLARFTSPDAKLNKARRGTLYGQDATRSVKHPCLVLFFKSDLSNRWTRTGSTDKGIPGGTARLPDGRDWFVLRNNPEWGDKPYSPDGTQGMFELGNAKMKDLAKARYVYVAYMFGPAVANRDIQILHNEVDHCGRQGIWFQRSENVLIQGNKVHHNNVTGIQIESLCRRVWIDGNISFANNLGSSHETGIWLDETIDAVVQNNIVYENQKGMGVTQCEWVLVRRNVILDNKAQRVPSGRAEQCKANSGGFWFSGGRHYHLGAPPGAEYNAFVHNTLYDNGADSSRWGGLQHGLSGYPKIGRNHFINNLVQSHHGALVMDLWYPPGIVDGNIYYGTRPLGVRWRNDPSDKVKTLSISSAQGLMEYRRASGLDAHSIVAPVEFVDVGKRDFRPAPGSIAIDRGQPLTQTRSAGSGSVVPVEDVRCFSAGLQTSTGRVLIPGDEIMIAGHKARITAIDRTKSLLTLDRTLRWKKGAPVSYPFKGGDPDVGAFEVR